MQQRRAAQAGTAGPAATSDAPDIPVPSFPIPEPSRWALEVVGIAPVTPSVLRLRLAARPVAPAGSEAMPPLEGAELVYAPGQDLALSLPGPGDATINRRYTISDYDSSTSVVELEVVTHGDGPGARWITKTRVGDRVEAFGPRGKITVVEGASTHLFVGDEASFAAIAAIVRALLPSARAIVLADVADEQEHRRIEVPPEVVVEKHWLHRDGAPAESPERVLEALAAVELDPAESHAYVFGEFHVVSAARRQLGERLGAARTSPKPYWRAGRPNAGHGEPVRDE
jgi:NADPH-dependent ferric siderophore reductase